MNVPLPPFDCWPSLSPRTVLVVHACFPANPFDVEMFLHVLTRREEEGHSAVQKNSGSEIIKVVTNSLRKKRGQAAMAGIVALSYIFLNNKGIKPSLERASKLASEVGYLAGKVIELEGAGNLGVHQFTMNAEVAGVKKIFRNYRSVAHIWAAELCIPTWDEPESTEMLNRSPYPISVLAFQKALQESVDTSSWAILELEPILPKIVNVQPDWGRGPTHLFERAFFELSEAGVF